MNCYEGLLGYSFCSVPGSYSIDITEIPGVSLEFLESIRVRDIDSVQGLITALNRRALTRVENLIFKSIKTQKTASYCFGKLVVPVVELENTGSNPVVNLQYAFTCCDLSFRIDSLVFYSPLAQSVTFTAVDFLGNTVWTHSGNMLKGKNEIKVGNVSDWQDNITISHNASVYYRYDESNCCTACNETLDCCMNVQKAMAGGGGFSVNYSIFCDRSKFICENIDGLRGVFISAVAEQIVIEREASFRSNVYTETKYDQYAALLRRYSKEVEERATLALEVIDIASDGCCYECGEGLTYTYYPEL